MTTQIELLKKYKIPVRGHLGQHLLIDPNVARKIVQLLDLKPGDVVLEVGPGLGALTWLLLEHPIRVLVVEKDKRFVEILRQEWQILCEQNSVKSELRLEHADFLEWNLEKEIQAYPTIKVVSNLPYYITAPILFRLIENRTRISQAVLMMQKEVAARLSAKPGSEDYGRLTLGVQYAADLKASFDVPPACFTPQPEVGSSVIQLCFKQPLFASAAEERFFDLVKLAFSQRRKTLVSLLARSGWFQSRGQVLGLVQTAGLPADVRGEKLNLKDFLKMTEILMEHLQS
jgi:16S rRNA (adenine1518-N6/adenine1519-N6)-dimethyltransferase